MRLIQIRYFLAVAECKTITKAAQQLFISQPALSKQLNMLEEELGVRLMDRLPRGIELTETGQQFAADCRRIISDLDAAVSRAMLSGNTRHSTLRLGCFDGAYIDDFMPALYRHLQSFSRDMKIRLSRRPLEENRRALKADEIDMLIELRLPEQTYEDEPNEMLSRTLISRSGALVYSRYSPLAQKKPLTISDFASEPFLVSTQKENQELAQQSLKTLAALGISKPVTETMDNLMSAMSTLRLGHGYLLLARQAADHDPDLLSYELPGAFDIQVAAVWKKKNAMITSLMESFSIT